MKTRMQWTMALAALAVSALTSAAQAQPPLGRGPGPDGPGPGGPPPMMGALARLLPPPDRWSELGLTDAQQEQVEALHDDEARATVRAEADARLAEMDLARMLERDTGDQAALDAAVAKVAAARADLLRAHVAMIRAARRVLTAE